MIIQKFGGSHFINEQTFNNFINILKNINDKSVIVISALGKTTRLLRSAAYAAESRNHEEWEANLAAIEKFHIKLINNLNLSKNSIRDAKEFIVNKVETLKQYFASIEILEELTPRTLDSILAFGEEIALFIFSNYLAEKSISFSQIDARKIIITDDNFNNANPDLRQIQNNINEKLIPLFDANSIVLTQGFIGSTDYGETTTMGFESSNLSAILLAYALNAKEIIIWTNVEGVYTADPNIIKNPKHIPQISFADAKLSAAYGNKLFYPKMLQLCEKYNIHIYYKSVLNPNGKFTILNNDTIESIPMINILDGLSLMKYNGMNADKANLITDEIYPDFFRDFRLFTHNPENIKLLLVSNNSISFWTDLHLEHFAIPKSLVKEGQSIIYILNIDSNIFIDFLKNHSDILSNYEIYFSQIQENVYAIATKSESSREVANKINEYLFASPK
ncbi:MAG TPA: aspartate kinase [Candidatus Kapabacteria bacterium]|jgi:aspartate kinase|nr:aspartate kinase [Candidatus Kapabacteria bacterium]HOV92951.1 aspartate kinase [Candidatus Kapabacteria bacterium]